MSTICGSPPRELHQDTAPAHTARVSYEVEDRSSPAYVDTNYLSLSLRLNARLPILTVYSVLFFLLFCSGQCGCSPRYDKILSPTEVLFRSSKGHRRSIVTLRYVVRSISLSLSFFLFFRFRSSLSSFSFSLHPSPSLLSAYFLEREKIASHLGERSIDLSIDLRAERSFYLGRWFLYPSLFLFFLSFFFSWVFPVLRHLARFSQ